MTPARPAPVVVQLATDARRLASLAIGWRTRAAAPPRRLAAASEPEANSETINSLEN
jgi:hypothetical protein